MFTVVLAIGADKFGSDLFKKIEFLLNLFFDTVSKVNWWVIGVVVADVIVMSYSLRYDNT